MSPPDGHGARLRVGYVLKMYPRFSETFIVNEILAHEAAGVDVRIFSLRPPGDGRFHATLADVRAPVTYVDHRAIKPTDLWRLLRTEADAMGQRPGALDALLAADVGDAKQALEVAGDVRAQGITHLHAHFGSVATTVARLVSALTGVPFTFTAHAKDIFHEEVDADDLRTKVRDASACVTVSDFNVDHLRHTLGPVGDVVRIYNGLHLDRFPWSDPAHRRPEVVAVGRLVEKKGFADLIDAIGLLRRSGRAVPCTIVGSGPLEAALRQRVEQSGLGDLVSLAGARPQHEVVEVVAGASAMVAPCVVGGDGNRDGMPTVLLEAMALGTPCIATPVTGVPELVADGETGLLVPPSDPGAVAQAIASLLDDAPLRTRLARGARRRIEEDYDVARQSRRLREVFRGDHGALREVG
jgi:glycosyltransferase involved in cell wall biosynthesis